jgi:hypothetical protein
MEEIWKDRDSFDAWCAEFAENCKEEADDDGNNSAYERESDAGLVPIGREVVATARGDSKPSRWPRLLLAVALVLLAGALLAAALGPVCAEQVGLAGWASSNTAGDMVVGEQSALGSPRLRGAAEAAVGAAGARTPPARASRVAAAPEGAGSASALEEDVSDSAKTLEQTNTGGEELESRPDNFLSNVTPEGTWDKEPAALDSVSNDSNVTVAAKVYD